MRNDVDGRRIVRVDLEREAELRWQAGRQVDPLPSTIVGAVHAAMVLLIERVGRRRIELQLVDAVPELGRGAGNEVGANALVARGPGQSAIDRLERAGGRDRDPQPLRRRWMGDDRMQDQAAGAGLPTLAAMGARAIPRRATRSGRCHRCGTVPPARRRRRACRCSGRRARSSASSVHPGRNRYRGSIGSRLRRRRCCERRSRRTTGCRRRRTASRPRCE